jgi:hypothetical protein
MNWLIGTLIGLGIMVSPGVALRLWSKTTDLPALFANWVVAAIITMAVISLEVPFTFFFVASIGISLAFSVILILITNEDMSYYSSNKLTLQRSKYLKLAARFVLVMIAIFSVATIYQYGASAPVQNAAYFNSLITFAPGSQLFANNTLFPLSHLPIVSEPYALSIANGKLSNWGGSAKIVDSEQIINGSIPYWLFTVASTNTIGTDHELGYILVSAIDGSDTIIKQTGAVGAGLWWTNNIGWATYLNND